MIDRREFVQSMIALGAATTLRPATALVRRADQELKDLADAALATARTGGRLATPTSGSTAIATSSSSRATASVQNIVNTEDFGFGVRVLRRRHVGLREQQRRHARTTSPRSPGRRVGIARANKAVNTDPVQLAPVDAFAGRRVEYAGQEGSRSRCRCSRRSICCCRSTKRR